MNIYSIYKGDIFMQTSIYCAIQTLLRYDICELPLLGKDIEKIIQMQGFDIISFDLPVEQSQAKDFKELGILDIVNIHKAFTYVNNDNKYVFYRSTLSAEEKNILLAHELGHIRLGHFSSPGIRCSSDFRSKSFQEIEADEFAIELLAPTCILKKYKQLTPDKISHLTLLGRSNAEHVFFKVQQHNTNTKTEQKLCNIFNTYHNKKICNRITKRHILAFSVLIVVSVTFIRGYIQNNKPASQATDITQSEQQLNATDEIVIITKSGEKYHLPDCRYVENKTNTITMTEQEALDAGYEPCAICRPNK